MTAPGRSYADWVRDCMAALWVEIGREAPTPKPSERRTPYEISRDDYLENLAEERVNPDAFDPDGWEADRAADRVERLADQQW